MKDRKLKKKKLRSLKSFQHLVMDLSSISIKIKTNEGEVNENNKSS
tara:strand:- start:477 stop:614 length:138 start_codon:yes stop_codon:yes gene_type:complete